jgi:hypothetical protein
LDVPDLPLTEAAEMIRLDPGQRCSKREDVVRHAICLLFALCISSIGGTAFAYLVLTHGGGPRWVYTAAAFMFITGAMLFHDEVVTPCE